MKAIAIGSIGALTETSEIQRRCFNQALAEYDTGLYWNVATYCDAIQTPGGFSRLVSLGLSDQIARAVHHRKQELYADAIMGIIVPRAGICRLMADCVAKNIPIGFVTTTTQQTVDAIKSALGDQIDFDQFDIITTANDVAKPKPHADIYHFALRHFDCQPEEFLVIEDTQANVAAAQNAKIKSCFTPGDYAVVSGMTPTTHELSYASCEAQFYKAA